ncbi:colicin immunity domain-containing protein [Mycobacterium sp. SMC-4]|uniref:colicin immunity domain-containing protein n=1 Tax=Mycobacterium sp. SMC-4 TaxID=2857059 RepID=UPI003D022B8A
MESEERRLPDISVYLDLIDSFIDRAISAAAFAERFLKAFKAERRTLGKPVYPILQELFEDADAHVVDPNLRTDPADIDDERLLECALRARRALRDIGFQ